MDMKKVVSILKREKRKTIRTKDTELYNALVLAIGCIEGTMDNKAKWLWGDDFYAPTSVCSHCGYNVDYSPDSCIIEDNYNFCPNCGACMLETK